MVFKKNELTDIEVFVHHRTASAALVSDDGDDDNAVWLPLSQIELDPDVDRGKTTLTGPTWLLQSKELI
jgi:hypothetical protein